MSFLSIADDVKLGENVKLAKFINLYGCTIGDNTKIGAFVEIQKNAVVGNNCKISSHTFICEGVSIEDDVFIGHGVIFTNDTYPRATSSGGRLQTEADWKVEPTLVKKGASIGSGATILANVTIGEKAIVGAGAVVTSDVAPNAIVAGNPARFMRFVDEGAKAQVEGRGAASPSRVPFLDLVTPHLELEEELVGVFRSALKSAGFIGGKPVEGFEGDFAAFCGTKHCIGAGSGTDALRFALIAAGIGPGDIVLTVPNTFIATTEAISQSGASPDFVDVFESTCNIDPEKLREYLESRCVEKSGRLFHRERDLRIAGVVPVHLYGQPADMEPILELARKYNLIVIEDACQAHGAEYFSTSENRWKRAGSMGVAAAFSFYPGKNLGACGEAGAVTTDDAALAARVRMLRDHGQAKKYYHDVEGWNGRLDAIQAGILQVKLRHLPEWNQKRRECAAVYSELLGEVRGVSVPSVGAGMRPVWHLYVIQTERRDALRKHLEDQGVGTGLHYPVPLHLQKSYLPMNLGAGSFPAAEAAASRILSLPMGPTLTRDQVERVAELIRRFAG